MSDDDVRVLVVDDVADAAESLAALLSSYGYVARTAHDGEGALGVVKEFHPHCVLLDVNMPGMDGRELSQHIRAIHGDNIVLVAITGGGASDTRVSETFSLVDHYLQKPLDIAALDKILPPRVP